MEHSILNYAAENDYFMYLDSLDRDAQLKEFYAINRLKKAITKRIDQICCDVYNIYRPLLVEIDRDDITNCKNYFRRVLVRFEMFLKRQRQHINELRDLYDPRPIRSLKPTANFDVCDVFRAYDEVTWEFQRLEKLVSAFEEAKNLTSQDMCKLTFNTEDGVDTVDFVKLDDNNDSYLKELENMYDNLVWIIDVEIGCDISVFKDKSGKK